jgi:hypothetical protein
MKCHENRDENEQIVCLFFLSSLKLLESFFYACNQCRQFLQNVGLKVGI